MPQALNRHHSSHFNAFWQVKINKIKLPLTKNEKCQFVQGKSVWKGLKICTYRFLGMPITVHYVRTLCEKYFVELWWFFVIFDRKFMYRVLKHCVGVELDQRRTAAYVPFHFDGISTPFYATYLLNIWFSGTTYHRDLKQVPLDLAHLKP